MDTVYVDCETTSLIEPHLPTGRRTWEIALVRVSDPFTGEHPKAAWLQITDVDLTHANPVSLEIGRFAERFIPACDDEVGCDHGYGPVGPAVTRPWGDPRPVELWGSTEANAAVTIDELTAGAVIAGSNPLFDMANMADLLRRHGALGHDEEPRWYHHPRDVANYAAGWLLGRHQLRGTVEPADLRTGPDGQPTTFADWSGSSYSTRSLSLAVGVPEPADRHSAWADVLWMMDVDAAIGGPSVRLGQPSMVRA